MRRSEIIIPPRLDFDRLRRIASSWPHDVEHITLNMRRQKWVYPIGTTGLSCLVAGSILRGQNVCFDTDGCQNLGYWGRMGFFENFGLYDLGKQGQSRAPQGRFSVIRRVTPDTDNDRIAHEIVQVQQANAEAYQIFQHIVSEALNNISQHSTAEGFTASQYYDSQGRSAFCIADHGCGLRTALRRFDLSDDAEAIRKALEAGVSGRSRTQQLAEPEQMRNRGVGLSIIRQLIVKNGGQLRIWSGSAAYTEEGNEIEVRSVTPWNGTLLSAILPRDRIMAPFDEIATEIMSELRRRDRERPRRVGRLP